MTKQTQTTFQWHQIAICIIIAFTFFMSGFISERVFEHLPHLEDEVAYLYQARIFAGGQIVVDSPQPTSAYWQPFVVDYAETGNRFGKYTPGWSALLAIGVVLGYEQIVNMLVSALTVALVYRLGREIFNPDVGLIGALLVAFSPAALLLNGTLMSHTTGLFFTTLFIYAYWRIEKNRQTIPWGIVAGVSLGILAATRPLTTLGIGLPFIIWSGVRLLFVLNQPKQFVSRLLPLLTLSVFALFFASSIPAFSQVATGDYQQNLYELVWSYDRIGFGDCCGRNFHRLQKAVNHARFDLSLTAADLFGWQFEPVTDEMIRHLQTESDYYEGTGYSFYLLPLGIIIGLQLLSPLVKRWHTVLMFLWAIGSIGWIWLALDQNASLVGLAPDISSNITFTWVWIITALIWLFAPMLMWYHYNKQTPEISYTWLLVSVVGSVVIIQMLYWIGSQRYSTRYYYEALSASALLTAIPFATLIRYGAKMLKQSRIWRMTIYTALLVLCVFTLVNYSLPRVNALYRFNGISPELIEQVQSARSDDRPILAIINGVSTGDDRVRWRAYASLMAITSPYLDSDIVAVRATSETMRQDLIADYPNRQVIDIDAIGNDAIVRLDG